MRDSTEVSGFARQLDDWGRDAPVRYHALAGAIERLIREGELAPHARLPAERRLAGELVLSRGTVTAAFELLRQRGLIETRRGSGSFVLRAGSPVSGPREAHLTSGLPRESLLWPRQEKHPEMIDLRAAHWVGAPEVEGVLDNAMRQLRRVLQGGGYDVLGERRLREAVAARFDDLGVPTSPDEILITSGAQQAISLIVQLLVGAGDTVVVEDPTFPGAVEAVVAQQANPLPVPTGEVGIELPRLSAAVAQARPRLMYLMSSVHNPTGVVMPPGARQRLAELLTGWDLTVLDDTALLETQRRGRIVAPLVGHVDPPATDRVLTVGSLSKSIWGGLRIGWIRASRPMVGRLARLKGVADLGTSPIPQLVAAELLAGDTRLIDRRRQDQAARQDALETELARQLPGWAFTPPAGGLCLWVDLGIEDAAAFLPFASEAGVALAPSRAFSWTGRHPGHVRLPFSEHPEVLAQAVTRLHRAWDAFCGANISADGACAGG